MKKIFIYVFLTLAILTACSQPVPEPDAKPAKTATPYPKTILVELAPYLPKALSEMVASFELIESADASQTADIRLDVGGQDADFNWVYALAAPFSYIGEGVSSADLQRFWQGKIPVDFPADMLYVDGSTAAVFEKLWGSSDGSTVRIIDADDLLSRSWESERAFSILPFDQLEPSWQVLPVDGVSPIRKDFTLNHYALTVPFSFIGNSTDLTVLNFRLAEAQVPIGSLTNRYADQLTTVITTGVTALVRGTAYIMEASGMTYPAIDIGDILREADILHINNEVPFAETCPNPFSNPYNDENMIFCSKPEYIQLLEAIGTDVVELAGDHFWNWGEAAMVYTIDLYADHGWQYYGGGRNYSDGVAPALFEHNGNYIAFLGCNAKPPGYATASDDFPGAVQCDLDIMEDQISAVLSKGYTPIFTFQHTEYYDYGISPSLQDDFQRIADAGAVIVQGSQAHHAHAVEFYKNAFMHYGLGNLFFDQYYESAAQREAFIDRHVFYAGKHISTEMISIQFIDNARPRLMTDAEREALLTKVFTASGW